MKTTKKLLSVILATMLLLCMATTAFAAPTPIDNTAIDVSQTDTVQMVTKTWTAKSLSKMNDTEEFMFNLTYAGAEKINESIDTAIPQLGGLDMTFKTATITGTWKTNATAAGTKFSATESITLMELFSGITFSAPGEYTFSLSEVAGSNENIRYSTATYTITVVVVYDVDAYDVPMDELSIISITTKDKYNIKSDLEFQNEPSELYDLTVSKTVKGMSANVDEYFAFAVTLTGVATGTYEITGGSHADNPAIITAGEETVIYLKHGESFVIHDLPLDTTYLIIEDNGDYETSHIMNENRPIDGYMAEGATAEGYILEGENICEFINTKTPPTITGYLMDVLPFVLLFGTALAGIVVFFVIRRRRREDYLGESL